MEAYRYQQIAYLVVPVMLGLEFFQCAKDEKGEGEETSLGVYALDILGFVFAALFPAIFAFTIWAVETKAFPEQSLPLARLDRYAVLFFFYGRMVAGLSVRSAEGKENAEKRGWEILSVGAFSGPRCVYFVSRIVGIALESQVDLSRLVSTYICDIELFQAEGCRTRYVDTCGNHFFY
jgi:hypothetical protein